MISKRLEAIEKRLAIWGTSNVEVDAKAFTKAILHLADRFDDADAAITAPARVIRMSAAQRLAWALRFGTPDEFNTAIDDALEMVA